MSSSWQFLENLVNQNLIIRHVRYGTLDFNCMHLFIYFFKHTADRHFTRSFWCKSRLRMKWNEVKCMFRSFVRLFVRFVYCFLSFPTCVREGVFLLLNWMFFKCKTKGARDEQKVLNKKIFWHLFLLSAFHFFKRRIH